MERGTLVEGYATRAKDKRLRVHYNPFSRIDDNAAFCHDGSVGRVLRKHEIPARMCNGKRSLEDKLAASRNTVAEYLI